MFRVQGLGQGVRIVWVGLEGLGFRGFKGFRGKVSRRHMEAMRYYEGFRGLQCCCLQPLKNPSRNDCRSPENVLRFLILLNPYGPCTNPLALQAQCPPSTPPKPAHPKKPYSNRNPPQALNLKPNLPNPRPQNAKSHPKLPQT